MCNSLSAFTSGPNCQTNINECASNPCLNQGTCIDDVAGYKCNCVLPYTGTKILFHLCTVRWYSGMFLLGGHFPHTGLLKELAKRKTVPLMKQLSSKVQLQDFLRFHLKHPRHELENDFMSSQYYFNKQAVIDGLTADFLEFFLAKKKQNTRTLNNKKLLAGWGGNGALDTFPVCLLPVSQNSKWLHNGRKLEPASCQICVLWKQIDTSLQASSTDRAWLLSSDNPD